MPKKFEYVADLGAYNGDTIREILEYSPNVKAITAFEPDRRNFKKLSDLAASAKNFSVVPVNAAAWCEDTVLSFADSGNRNSGAFAKGRRVDVQALTLDGVLSGERVDYIKYDVEGAEAEALHGSRETILAHHPTILLSAYHRSEDIFSLPLQMHELDGGYSLYYRRYPYVPAWDLNLFCVYSSK